MFENSRSTEPVSVREGTARKSGAAHVLAGTSHLIGNVTSLKCAIEGPFPQRRPCSLVHLQGHVATEGVLAGAPAGTRGHRGCARLAGQQRCAGSPRWCLRVHLFTAHMALQTRDGCVAVRDFTEKCSDD